MTLPNDYLEGARFPADCVIRITWRSALFGTKRRKTSLRDSMLGMYKHPTSFGFSLPLLPWKQLEDLVDCPDCNNTEASHCLPQNRGTSSSTGTRSCRPNPKIYGIEANRFNAGSRTKCGRRLQQKWEFHGDLLNQCTGSLESKK